MQSHSRYRTTRTSPPITRQLSKSKSLTQTTLQKRKKTPPPIVRTSTPTETISTPENTDFLYEDSSQVDRNQYPIVLQTPTMTSQPSRSETNLLDGDNMEVDPLSDSVTQINLSGILNKTIQPEPHGDSPVDEGLTQTTNFIETRGKRLKAALTIIAKASHHKAFMETCLSRNSPPKNMSLWIQPHIYHSNPEVEKQWKDTLHQASLNLTTTLIDHYKAVIKVEQETLEKITKEITEYLKHLSGTSREEEITKWKQQSKNAEEEARKLSESLKESRESKLFRKRKRTESTSNLRSNPSKQALFPSAPKQPHLQTQPPTDFLEALTGLIQTYSKNGRPQQQQHQQQSRQQQQSTRGKEPANGRGFQRKGVPPPGR